MRIYLVVNISQVVEYKEQVERQKVIEVKLTEVDGVKEWKVEKNTKQKKNKRSNEVLGMMEGVYSRK